MRNVKFEIQYEELFLKWPIIKKCYYHYLKLFNQNKLPTLFTQYKLFYQNNQILVYPIGTYLNKDIKLIYAVKDETNNTYAFDEISLTYALNSLVISNPKKMLNLKNLNQSYNRLFSIAKAKKFFGEI